jgi:hypothetical protein
VGLEDVEHDFLVGEGDRVEPGDRLHDHAEVPQVQSATYKQFQVKKLKHFLLIILNKNKKNIFLAFTLITILNKNQNIL